MDSSKAPSKAVAYTDFRGSMALSENELKKRRQCCY